MKKEKEINQCKTWKRRFDMNITSQNFFHFILKFNCVKRNFFKHMNTRIYKHIMYNVCI